MILYEELLSNESKFIERLRRREIIKSKLPYNISNYHIEYTRDYLITVGSLKTFLDEQRNLRKLSKSGVRHLLKNELKFSYK